MVLLLYAKYLSVSMSRTHDCSGSSQNEASCAPRPRRHLDQSLEARGVTQVAPVFRDQGNIHARLSAARATCEALLGILQRIDKLTALSRAYYSI